MRFAIRCIQVTMPASFVLREASASHLPRYRSREGFGPSSSCSVPVWAFAFRVHPCSYRSRLSLLGALASGLRPLAACPGREARRRSSSRYRRRRSSRLRTNIRRVPLLRRVRLTLTNRRSATCDPFGIARRIAPCAHCCQRLSKDPFAVFHGSSHHEEVVWRPREEPGSRRQRRRSALERGWAAADSAGPRDRWFDVDGKGRRRQVVGGAPVFGDAPWR